nr:MULTISPECIES: hypothetical protein [Streptomyces]
MNANRTMGRWSAATVLPVALLAATVATNGAAASASPAPGEAAFVLDASTGSFVTTRTALASGGVHTVKAYTGKATDSEILAAGAQHVIADVTLAHSANRTERAAWAASAKFVDLSWPDLGAASYTVIRDGRDYSSAVSGTSFRAGVRGVVYWTRSSYELFPETGWTKVYNKKGKLVDKRKASTKKIDFRTKTRFDGKTRRARSDRSHRPLLPQVWYPPGRHRRVLRRPPRSQR